MKEENPPRNGPWDKSYFVSYRNNFDDRTGWFTKQEVDELVEELAAENNNNEEYCIYNVVKGVDVTSQFWNEVKCEKMRLEAEIAEQEEKLAALKELREGSS